MYEAQSSKIRQDRIVRISYNLVNSFKSAYNTKAKKQRKVLTLTDKKLPVNEPYRFVFY